jgi:hypothetical protein
VDPDLRFGVFISLILGGVPTVIVGILSLSEACLYVGIPMLVLAAIWGFLFLCPKSPVKKHLWAIPDKLMFTTPQELGYEPKVKTECISVWVDLTSLSGIMVDMIALKIRWRKGIPSFEWNSHVLNKERKYLDFKRPDYLNAGKYKARLIAYTPEGYSKSREFILEV